MDLENQGPALSPGRFLPGKPSGLLCVLRVGWKGGTPGRAGAAEHGRGGVKQGVGAGRGGSGGRERRESESGGGGGAGGPERKNILCPPPDARGGAGEGGEVVGGGRTRWGEARGGERRGLRPRPGPRPYEVPLPPLPGLLPPFFQSPRLRRRKELPRGPRIRSWPGASACTNDDIALVGSMLDDKDNSVKIQALNTLKAFSGIRKFRLKIQLPSGHGRTPPGLCKQQWNGWMTGMPNFSSRVVPIHTLYQPCMSVPGVSPLSQHFVFSHFQFLASHLFWGKRGCLGLHLLAASTSSSVISVVLRL
nr:armadillo repeat-containing protein 12 isoform X7 [Vicugna pacos]